MVKLVFKYKRTVLNISVVVGELVLLIFTVLNWEELSKGEGWGIVYIIGLCVFIATGLIIDLILQLVFKKERVLNIIGFLVVLIYLYMIFLSDK